MSTQGLTPLPPPRIASQQKVTFQGAQTWKESIAIFMATLLAITVFISVICTAYYVFQNRAVYEELVDYLDKTISISKINFNPRLGMYQLSEKELEALGDQRTYKTSLLIFLLSDGGCYILLAIGILLYFSTDVSQGTAHILYWVAIGLAVLYSVVQIHVFVFFLFPYSGSLPNSTEQLLNHAIPHNPGGLMQMEQRLGCTFDYNLYMTNKRRQNPKNTCDPEIESSFMSQVMLIVLLILRLLPIVFFVLLIAKRTPFSEAIAQMVERMRPDKLSQKKRLYVKKQHYRQATYQTDVGKSKSTTFAATNAAADVSIRPAPSPLQVDHSISYNNAAFFATSGAYGLNSSRSSEISRMDVIDLNKPTHYNSGSVMSEV